MYCWYSKSSMFLFGNGNRYNGQRLTVRKSVGSSCSWYTSNVAVLARWLSVPETISLLSAGHSASNGDYLSSGLVKNLKRLSEDNAKKKLMFYMESFSKTFFAVKLNLH